MGSTTKVRGLLNVFRESAMPDDATIVDLRAILPPKFINATDKQIADSWGHALAHRTFVRSIRSAIHAGVKQSPELFAPASPPKPPALSETEIREFVSLAGDIRHATMRMVELFQKARG